MSAPGLFALCGGSGERLLVLLHGMGATAEVWRPMLETADAHWQGRWIAPDLRGHGRSPMGGPFGIAMHGADIAALIAHENASDVLIAGHSFGGAVGALVGSGLYGVMPSRVAAFGIKLTWTDDEAAKMQELSAKPQRVFASRAEAVERHLKLAGLFGKADPAADICDAGIEQTDAGYRVALASGVFCAVDKRVTDIVRLCRAPLRLGSGSRDAMAPLDDMLPFDKSAAIIPGAGHNAHWENPDAAWRFVLGD